MRTERYRMLGAGLRVRDEQCLFGGGRGGGGGKSLQTGTSTALCPYARLGLVLHCDTFSCFSSYDVFPPFKFM